MTAPAPCEACRSAPASTCRETFDLCDACLARLEARALRPLEWFRLAARRGPRTFLLHDDLYAADGTATCPEDAVVEPERWPIPALASLEGDVDGLVDFAVTRYLVHDACEPELVAALRRLDPSVLLDRITARVARGDGDHVEGICLAIAALAVGPQGGHWVEERYAAPDREGLLGALAFAAGRCLAEDVAFALASQALASTTGELAGRAMGSLGWLRDPRALDWLEAHVTPPILGTWGTLAALSRPRWSRLAGWLSRGRPLSLVALDALRVTIAARATGFVGESLMVRWELPELLDAPPRAVAEVVLRAAEASDDTPRVRRAVEVILRRWPAAPDAS